MKAFHVGGKRVFKTQKNLVNMNVTIFSSRKCDTIHFKCAMNAIMWVSL